MKVVVHPDYSHVSDFIRQLPSRFQQEGEMLYDKRNKVKRFIVNGETLIVKKFKYPHLIQRITYTFFKKSKAERAYLYANIFRQRGFQTPHEIAYIEIKRNGLFADSYFVSTECSDAPLMPILNKEGFDRGIAQELAHLLADLHQKGILHGDLNLNNILYRKENGKYLFTLIDTNRSRFIPSPDFKTCMENLKRLTHNKELMEDVVRKYAVSREWEPNKCILTVLHYLTTFEAKKQKKRKLQSLLGLKKK